MVPVSLQLSQMLYLYLKGALGILHNEVSGTFTEPRRSLVLSFGGAFGSFNKLLLWGTRKGLAYSTKSNIRSELSYTWLCHLMPSLSLHSSSVEQGNISTSLMVVQVK